MDDDLRRIGAGTASLVGRFTRWAGRRVEAEVVAAVGGPARARVILLFGAILGLSSADAATIGAAAGQLEKSLHIGNAELGLLTTVALVTGGVASIPVGMLVDRTNRVKMLAISVVLWSVASLASGAAGSYTSLLLTRLALGAVTATAGPAIASLMGDYFSARERGRVYGYVLGGETAGTAVGFLISGALAGITWRLAFWALVPPGLWLARELWFTVPEPRRDGQSRLHHGAEDLFAAARGERPDRSPDEPPTAEEELAREAVRKQAIEPDPRLVIRGDPAQLSLMQAVRYVLRVPTNVTIIIASSLGYFFLAGLQTFAIVFVRGHFDTGQFTATGILGLLVVGALIGTLISGRLSDWMLRRGHLTARMLVPGVSFILAAALLIPGLTGHSLTPALWFDIAAAGLISAANPPLDAARLDIMPAGLWGRAEAVRTLLRTVAQGIAPLLFGAIADLVAGLSPEKAPIGTNTTGNVPPGTAHGLEVAFLVMLIPLVAAGVFLLRARRHYPRDVATAAAAGRSAPVAATAAPGPAPPPDVLPPR